MSGKTGNYARKTRKTAADSRGSVTTATGASFGQNPKMAATARQIISQHLEICGRTAGARDNHNIIALHRYALCGAVAHQRTYHFAQAALTAVAHNGIANLAAGCQAKTKWSIGSCCRTRLHNKTRARPTLGVAGYVLEVSAVDQFLYRLGHQHQRQAIMPCRPFVLCPIPCGIIAAIKPTEPCGL